MRVRWLAVAGLCDGAVLGGFRGDAERTLSRLPRLAAWFATDGSDRVAVHLAVTAAWLAATWLAFGLVAALGSRLPGAAGRWCALVARAALPRAMRGLVAGSAGLGIVLAPLAAGAAPLSPGPTVPVHPSGSPASGAHLAAAARPGARTPHPLPTPLWPTGHHSRPRTGNRARQPQSEPPAKPQAASPRVVTVRPDQSLWLLAARGLREAGRPATDREIAAAWPRWYAANLARIGPDPDLLRPGERLRVPAHLPAPHPPSLGGSR